MQSAVFTLTRKAGNRAILKQMNAALDSNIVTFGVSKVIMKVSVRYPQRRLRNCYGAAHLLHTTLEYFGNYGTPFRLPVPAPAQLPQVRGFRGRFQSAPAKLRSNADRRHSRVPLREGNKIQSTIGCVFMSHFHRAGSSRISRFRAFLFLV
jgi:hypothetical protein